MSQHDLTLVTALVDLGRGDMETDFSRGYDDYLGRFHDILQIDRPLVAFVDGAAEAVLWQHRAPANTHVHRVTVEDLARTAWWPLVQTIRLTPAWRDRAGWLAASPQAGLAAYNPLVMSKLPWLAEVAAANPFHSSHFAWIDAGLSRTVGASLLQSSLDGRAILARLQRFLFLCFPYEGNTEIHGFERDAMARRAGTSYVRWVARGGFFGGSQSHVLRAAPVYEATLLDTLRDGLMGTEESVFTILAHLHPALFDRYVIGADGLVWPFFNEVTRAAHGNH